MILNYLKGSRLTTLPFFNVRSLFNKTRPGNARMSKQRIIAKRSKCSPKLDDPNALQMDKPGGKEAEFFAFYFFFRSFFAFFIF